MVIIEKGGDVIPKVLGIIKSKSEEEKGEQRVSSIEIENNGSSTGEKEKMKKVI